MRDRLYGNEYKTTVVCVDSYEQGVLSGRFYNPYLKEGEKFHSLSQFLMRMNRLLDDMRLPQAYEAMRTFADEGNESHASCERAESGCKRQGELATFAVRVLFRQNASWQGTVAWLEGRRERNFRSALELVALMDSAMAGS